MKSKSFYLLVTMLFATATMKSETVIFSDGVFNYYAYESNLGISGYVCLTYGDYQDFTEAIIPDSVTYKGAKRYVYVNDAVFENCKKLERVHWSPNTGVPQQCFKNCESLSTFEIKSEKLLDGIGDEAFMGCSALKEFTIFQNVDYLGIHAFEGVKLEKLHWNAKECAGTFFDYEITGTGYNDPPNTVSWMGQICQALDSCMDVSSVKEITIGDNVRLLPMGFMHGAQISEVTIPASVDHMFGGTFADCLNLRKIICNVTNPAGISLGDNEFLGVDKELCTLYVPKGSAELYRQADQWKDFQNIVEEGEYDPYDINHDGLVDITDVSILIDYILGK